MAVLHRGTLGNTHLLEVNASPDGSDTAPRGSLATDSANGRLWVNTDGSTAWADATTDEANVLAALTVGTTTKDMGGGDIASVAEISQKDHTAFAGSESIQTTAAVQTTDATVTTLLSLALLDDSTYWVEAFVAVRGTVAGENAYKVAAKFSRRSAGAAVLGGAGSVNLFTDEEDLDWNVAWVASANNAVLQVTGEAATTINWSGTINYQRVSGNA